MINYDNLEKVGEYKEGKLNFWFKPIFEKEEADVYILKFREDYYIGSSANLKNRIYAHVHSLRNSKHSSSLVQNVFNRDGSFEVYLLMRSNSHICDAQLAEQGFILLLSPNLNVSPPKGFRNPFVERIWRT